MMAIVVGSTSFLLSYVALRDVAADTGAVSPSLAWAVPVCIDGGILAASAAIWLSAATKRKRDLLAFATVIVLLGTSVMINIQHAGPSVTAKWIAALPPIVLLACLELVASGHRHRLEDADEADVPQAAAVTPEPAETLTVTTPAPGPAEHTVPAVAVVPESAATPLPVSTPPVVVDVAQPKAPVEVVAPAPVRPEPATATGLSAGSEPAPAADTTAKPTPAVQPAEAARPMLKQPRVQAEAPATPAVGLIRAAFDRHVGAGGDPEDSGLAARIAEEAGVSTTYARRILKPLRESLTATTA